MRGSPSTVAGREWRVRIKMVLSFPTPTSPVAIPSKKFPLNKLFLFYLIFSGVI